MSQWASAARLATLRVTAAPDRWRPALTDLDHRDATGKALRVHRSRGGGGEGRVPRAGRAGGAARADATGPPAAREDQRSGVTARAHHGGGRAPVAPSPPARWHHCRGSVERVPCGLRPGKVVFVRSPSRERGAHRRRSWRASAAPPSRLPPGGAGRAGHPAALLAAPLPGGTVVESGSTRPPASGRVGSTTVSRPPPKGRAEGEAAVIVTLAGGEIEEGSDTRGVTQAAMGPGSGRRPARLSSTDIRTLMTGQKVRVRSWSAPTP